MSKGRTEVNSPNTEPVQIRTFTLYLWSELHVVPIFFQIYFDGKKNLQISSPLAELKDRAKTETVRAEVMKVSENPSSGPIWRTVSLFVGSSEAPAHTELVPAYNIIPHDSSLRYATT